MVLIVDIAGNAATGVSRQYDAVGVLARHFGSL